jgi:hypothetical protein
MRKTPLEGYKSFLASPEVGVPDLGVLEKVFCRALKNDTTSFHDVSAMRDDKSHGGVLFHEGQWFDRIGLISLVSHPEC